jgi:hypothetical protein
MQAVRVASPSPRGGGTPAEAAADAAPHAMDAEDGVDESLRLAMQLQQEELQWQQMRSRAAIAAIGGVDDDELDEDVRLAMRLQQEEDAGM